MLLIDCYNLLRATMPQSLAGLDEARLAQLIRRTPWAGQPALIVCDGSPKPGIPGGSKGPQIELVYAGPGRTADELIIEKIDQHSAPRRLTVVSSDREIQKAARRRRATAMGAPTFIGELARAAGRENRKRAPEPNPMAEMDKLPEHEVDRWLERFGMGEEAGEGQGPRATGQGREGRNQPTAGRVEAIDHVNIVVRDLPAMIGFYRDVLGFEVTREATIRGDWIEAVVGLAGVVADVVYLDLPRGPRVELIDYRSPKGKRPAGLGAPHAHGLRHLAFRVTGIDALAERLRAAGVKLFSDVQQVSSAQVTYAGGARKRLVYFQDPEGNLLELCEYG